MSSQYLFYTMISPGFFSCHVIVKTNTWLKSLQSWCNKQYCDFLSYVHRNSTQSKNFALNRNCWFLMILAKFYQKFLPNAKFGPVRPKELCVFFLCVFPFFFCYFFFFNSSPDLNFCLYSPYILQNFHFKNTKFSASDRARPTQTPPICHVCKCSIDADAPPNSPPPQLSKTGVQPDSPV